MIFFLLNLFWNEGAERIDLYILFLAKKSITGTRSVKAIYTARTRFDKISLFDISNEIEHSFLYNGQEIVLNESSE